MKCFYHNDMDGKCAGFWVCLSVGLNDGYVGMEDNSFIPIDYKDRFPMETIRPDEQIYIVDFSIQPSEMLELLSITQNVTWIDHHKTAIEKYQDFPYAIRGIRYDGVAGCMLAYCYIHHMTARGEGEIKPFDLSMTKDAPYFTKLIADWDVWTFEYGDKTRYFKLACDSLDLRPESEVWNKFFGSSYEETLIEKGATITSFRDQWAKSYMELGFEVVFEGAKCFAVNLGRCNSEYFKSLPQGKYDTLMPFVFDGSQYTVSMYSTAIDVSEIAKKYGGGGHKGAAGFQCRELPFRMVEP
ncbi:MAG: DHHA1 domain-containing protein [Dehalococcoidales bacterium]|nr:DHHA1 domain-containing protein [Dehalococcoidales bacterium]